MTMSDDQDLKSAARQSVWAVVGASGYVGSGVLAELRRQRDLTAVAVPAPRLAAAPEADARALIARLGQPAELAVVDALARQLAGADVVINAAGVAAPDSPSTAELFGANALLPAVVARAAARAGVRRLVHVSSAAVQDRRQPLDETASTQPVTPYATSKARGEAVLAEMARSTARSLDTTIFRATSVHGPGRPATDRLARLAASRLASVAGAGDRPTPVVHLGQLAEAIEFVGRSAAAVPPIVLSPWVGKTTAGVLRELGGREPLHLPTWLCRAAIAAGYCLSRCARGRGRALVRRAEVLWLGQSQVRGWLAASGFASSTSGRPSESRGNA